MREAMQLHIQMLIERGHLVPQGVVAFEEMTLIVAA